MLAETKNLKTSQRKTWNGLDRKKKKIKQSESMLKSELSHGNESLSQITDPIEQIIERMDRNNEDTARIFSNNIDSLLEFTSNLEIVYMPYQSKFKRNSTIEMNCEEESVLEKILKKPKTNTFLDYNFCLKSNVYLENMMKLNVENTILNEVSLCEESVVSDKETVVTNKTDKNVIYVYKSNYPNEKQVCIEITKSDLDKVPDNLLNDNIILFYLKLIHNEMIDQDKHNRSYIFNTYFYQKFFMNLNNLMVTQLSDKDYEKGFNAIKKVSKYFLFF
jgi:Ulp1 family protease